jgi:hypothetical protein
LTKSFSQTEIIIGDDSGFYERGIDGEKGKKLKKAEITLNDCLACSYVSLALYVRQVELTTFASTVAVSLLPSQSSSRCNLTRRFTEFWRNNP